MKALRNNKSYFFRFILQTSKFLFLILLLWGPITGWALDPNKAITQYIHEVWQTDEGLPQNSIMTIVQTSDGYLWLGTKEGLVRFDGLIFTVFDKDNTEEIKENYISALFKDKKGSLWIGTYRGGLNRLKDGKFTIYTTKEGLSDDFVLSIYEDYEGSLWIGTSKGLNRLKYGKFTTYTTKDGLPNDSVLSICEDREGSLWLGTNVGLVQFKNGKFITYTTKEGLSHNIVLSIYEDREENLWIGTPHGLNQFKDGKFTIYTEKDGLSGNFVVSIYKDREKNLWIGTHSGLNRFKDGKFTAYTSKDGLSNNFVRAIYEDKEGSLWIGTYGGLDRLKDGKFITYTTKEGLFNNFVKSIYEDRDGNLWIGTYGGGLNRFKDGTFTAYTEKDGLSNDFIRSIYEDKEGSLWIGTYSGLNRLKDGKFTTYTTKDGLSHHIVASICEDRKGNLWIGTSKGLNKLKDGKFITYTTKTSFSHDSVTSIYEDREGSLWIGTDGDGLKLLKDGKFITYTTKDGLSDNTVGPIYEDKEGILWIGTSGGGLNRFKDGKFINYKKKEGLFSNVIYQILEDGKKNLWMSCNSGIFRVNKKELNDFARGKIKSITSTSYSKADGMKRSECCGGTQPAGWKSGDGKLWFSTMKGVAMIDPENIKRNEQPPPVLIEQVLIDNESIDLDEKIRLSPGKKKFEFYYTGLSFLVPEKVLFKYKLEGFDSDWHDAGTRRTAYYTNIPPGHYHFRVIACNNDGVWNTAAASFDFYLKPYFYQSWWFYFIFAVGVTFSGVGIHRLRVRQLKKHKLELENRIKKRTSEIKAANMELTKEIIERKKVEEKIKKTIEELEAVNNELKDFAHIVSHDLKAPLRAVSQLATWISKDYADAFDKDGQEQMNLLTGRVKRMDNLIGGILQYSRAGRLMGKEEEVNLNSVVTEVIDNLAPPDNIKVTIENKLPVVRTDRVRIEQVFQNLISNAIKYMDKPKGEIKISCVDEGSFWKFSVSDNGPGIEEKYYDKIFQIFQTLESHHKRESTGVGLSVVRKIVELYGGKIWVESKLGLGSTFFFTLPKKG